MANSEVFSLTISSSINPLFLKRGVLRLCEIYHYRQYFLTKKVQTEEAKMKRKLKFVQNICFSAKKNAQIINSMLRMLNINFFKRIFFKQNAECVESENFNKLADVIKYFSTNIINLQMISDYQFSISKSTFWVTISVCNMILF